MQLKDDDVEKSAYLLHFLCTHSLSMHGKTPSNALGNETINQMMSLSEQVNAILLKGRLEQFKMAEFMSEFSTALTSLAEVISGGTAPQSFDELFTSREGLERLSCLLIQDQESNVLILDELAFFTLEEFVQQDSPPHSKDQDLDDQSMITPKVK